MHLSDVIPLDTIADSIPMVPGIDPREAVFNEASTHCSTESVHFVSSVQDGHIWYLAAPSRQIPVDTPCPLAIALPGHPDHLGNGGYMFKGQDEYVIVVVRKGEHLLCYVGWLDQAMEFCQEHGVPVIDVNDQEATAWEWEGWQLTRDRVVSTGSRMAGKAGWLAALAGAALPILAGISIFLTEMRTANATADQRIALQAIRADVKKLADDPLNRQVRSLDDLVSILAANSGRLKEWKVFSNNGLTAVNWTLQLPNELTDAQRQAFPGAVQRRDGDVFIFEAK
jgi:hypothetical protein